MSSIYCEQTHLSFVNVCVCRIAYLLPLPFFWKKQQQTNSACLHVAMVIYFCMCCYFSYLSFWIVGFVNYILFIYISIDTQQVFIIYQPLCHCLNISVLKILTRKYIEFCRCCCVSRCVVWFSRCVCACVRVCVCKLTNDCLRVGGNAHEFTDGRVSKYMLFRCARSLFLCIKSAGWIFVWMLFEQVVLFEAKDFWTWIWMQIGVNQSFQVCVCPYVCESPVYFTSKREPPLTHEHFF